ncbi:MAG: hypothetical protein ABFS46_05830 [Myxococcota bacterium]
MAYQRGEPARFEAIIAQIGELGRLGSVADALAAFFHAQLGRQERACAHLEELARDDFAGIPRDEGWLISVALAASAAIARCDSIGARPSGVAARAGLAELLHTDRPSRAARERARTLASEARATAEAIGIPLPEDVSA